MLQEIDQSREKKDQQNPQNDSANSLNEQTLQKQVVIAAHEQAEQDIEQDPDLSLHSPNDDLDEGETARLGDGKNDLI
ncbi:MAG: hypothetical protein WKF97_09510 [Chitinophagaceae bacterium]